MNNNYFNSYNNQHQLIQRTQNYYLQRKLVSFHSEDRDAKNGPIQMNLKSNYPKL